MSPDTATPSAAGAAVGFDHVTLPMRTPRRWWPSTGRWACLPVSENPSAVQVHVGDQMINLHRPELWQGSLPLRAPAAVPPCGDLCIVWQGSASSLTLALGQAGAAIVEGRVGRVGGRGVGASSIYVRDPDGNLLEFMQYQDESKEHARVS
jgi:catechol 2,3-dioxygenase-like lactoylglutathione lyase family enzyme